MKLRPEQIRKLVDHIYAKMQQDELFSIRAAASEVKKTMSQVLEEDVQKLSQIENNAKKTLQKFRTQIESGEIDERKMYGLVFKQLIKEAKFIL